MPLQNRVSPGGDVIAVASRGTMMGNRGLLHDAGGRIVRAWRVRRWITCVTSFRGRWAPVMRPGRYTRLFFLDEATAFSAGHRPCRECRYADYTRFRAFWATCFGEPGSVDAIDGALHAERLDGDRKRTWRAGLATLPDGTFVLVDAQPHLVWGKGLARWDFAGYATPRARPPRREVDVLTPRSIVEVFRAGYVPGVHSSLPSRGAGDVTSWRPSRRTSRRDTG